MFQADHVPSWATNTVRVAEPLDAELTEDELAPSVRAGDQEAGAGPAVAVLLFCCYRWPLPCGIRRFVESCAWRNH